MFKKKIVVSLCAVILGLMAVSGMAIADNAEKININTATVEDLVQLKGIGDVYAKRIVAYREAHGAFESIDALINVKGISKKTVEKNKHKITTVDHEKGGM